MHASVTGKSVVRIVKCAKHENEHKKVPENGQIPKASSLSRLF
jgi:hypothetical protein